MTEQSNDTNSNKNELQYDLPVHYWKNNILYTFINGRNMQSLPFEESQMITSIRDKRLTEHTMDKSLELDFSKLSKTIKTTKNPSQDKK